MLTEKQLDRYADILVWGLRTSRTTTLKRNDIFLIRFDLPALRLVGLMCMAPYCSDPEEVRGTFARLWELADDARTREMVGEEFCELSMGMSTDFDVAIEQGATMVRVGSALFDGIGSG